jgi:hypothetical protein
VDKKTVLYPFSLFLGETKLILYSLAKDDRESWINAFKSAMKYSSLTDFYEVKVDIPFVKVNRRAWERGSTGR